MTKPSTLTAFTDKHGLCIEINSRSPKAFGTRWTDDMRWFAGFANCDVNYGSLLIPVYGQGTTPDAALADYAKRISDKRLVLNAFMEDRREIRIPALVHDA